MLACLFEFDALLYFRVVLLYPSLEVLRFESQSRARALSFPPIVCVLKSIAVLFSVRGGWLGELPLFLE